MDVPECVVCHSISQTNVLRKIGENEKWPFLSFACNVHVIICHMKALRLVGGQYSVCRMCQVCCLLSSIASPSRPFGDSGTSKN